MNNEEILSKLQPIFQDVFDDEDLVVKNEDNAETVEDWDSLSQIRLTASIEKEFGIKFAFGELNKANNVGEMVNLIKDKM